MNIMLHGRISRCIINWDNVCGVGEYSQSGYNSLIATTDGKETKVIETIDRIAELLGGSLAGS